MVGKAKAVGGSAAGQAYLENAQKQEKEIEKQQQEALKQQANLQMKEQERGYELTRNMLIGETPKEINDELKAWNLDNPQASRLKRQVFTMVMSPSIEDGKKLSDDELIKMGKEFMAKTLGVDPDSQPYRMYVHTDKEHKHVHIYTPRTDKDGKTISDSFIGMRAQRAADEVALANGLTRAKTVVQERTQNLKETLREVATRSVSFEDYCQQAEKKGIKILPTINKQGQMQGYRVEFQGKDYKASAIDRKLTAPKLAPLFEQNLRKQKTVEKSQSFGMGM